MPRPSWYFRFSKAVSNFCGRPVVFTLAVAAILLWAATGPVFGFSNTWQLVVNTGTTIITFLMVFVIQSTQNRDTEAMQVKLDELIRATQGADNSLFDLEDLDTDQLDQLRDTYLAIAASMRRKSLEDGQEPGNAGS